MSESEKRAAVEAVQKNVHEAKHAETEVKKVTTAEPVKPVVVDENDLDKERTTAYYVSSDKLLETEDKKAVCRLGDRTAAYTMKLMYKNAVDRIASAGLEAKGENDIFTKIQIVDDLAMFKKHMERKQYMLAALAIEPELMKPGYHTDRDTSRMIFETVREELDKIEITGLKSCI